MSTTSGRGRGSRPESRYTQTRPSRLGTSETRHLTNVLSRTQIYRYTPFLFRRFFSSRPTTTHIPILHDHNRSGKQGMSLSGVLITHLFEHFIPGGSPLTANRPKFLILKFQSHSTFLTHTTHATF